MPRDGDDIAARNKVSPALELAVLRFWAAAMHMERSFSRQEIEALPELSRAIASAHRLPAAIGWDDVLTERFIENETRHAESATK